MQAILTKFIGPSNVRGARVKARSWAGTVIMSWDHAVNTEQNHRAAAESLAKKLGWNDSNYGPLVGGTLFNGSMCWVFRDHAD